MRAALFANARRYTFLAPCFHCQRSMFFFNVLCPFCVSRAGSAVGTGLSGLAALGAGAHTGLDGGRRRMGRCRWPPRIDQKNASSSRERPSSAALLGLY